MKLVECISGFEDRREHVRRERGERFQCDDARVGDLVKAGLVKVIEHNVPTSTTKTNAPQNKSAGSAPQNKAATLQDVTVQTQPDDTKTDDGEETTTEPETPTSLDRMTKSDLLTLATGYGIEVDDKSTKAEIIKLIEAARPKE